MTVIASQTWSRLTLASEESDVLADWLREQTRQHRNQELRIACQSTPQTITLTLSGEQA